MSGFLIHVASRIIGQPLLVEPTKAEVILHVLGGRIGVDVPPPGPEANRFFSRRADGAGRGFYRVVQDVAVIDIIGTLVNRGAWVGSNSGEVSYEGIEAQIETALADPDITAIVLDIDSPGGEAAGMFGLAEVVRRANTRKPVVALVNDMAASAAYGIASQAERILVSPTSITGSIGVVLVHLDRSGELEAKGIKPTLIHAGAHKVDGNPFAPLPDAVRADLEGEVQKYYSIFVDLVAAGRGERLSAAAARATEARTFLGDEAIARGLADAAGSFNDAVNLARSLSAARNERAEPAGGHMTEQTGAPVAENTGISQADHEAAVTAAREDGFNSGREEGLAAGATAERARILGIEKIAMAGHEDLAATLKADGTTTPEQAAMKFLEAEAETGKSAALGRMDAVEAAGGGVPAAPAATTVAKASTPEEWKAEWQSDPKLQAEFIEAEDYVAFKNREGTK